MAFLDNYIEEEGKGYKVIKRELIIDIEDIIDIRRKMFDFGNNKSMKYFLQMKDGTVWLVPEIVRNELVKLRQKYGTELKEVKIIRTGEKQGSRYSVLKIGIGE